jgi:hypothetical protein
MTLHQLDELHAVCLCIVNVIGSGRAPDIRGPCRGRVNTCIPSVRVTFGMRTAAYSPLSFVSEIKEVDLPILLQSVDNVKVLKPWAECGKNYLHKKTLLSHETKIPRPLSSVLYKTYHPTRVNKFNLEHPS